MKTKIVFLVLLSIVPFLPAQVGLFSKEAPLSRGCLQMDIVLLFDQSYSITSAKKEEFVYLFIKHVIDSTSFSEMDVRYAIIGFDDTSMVYVSLTRDTALLRAALAKSFLVSGGGTDLVAGVQAMIDEFSHSRPGAVRIGIIVSDGDVNSPSNTRDRAILAKESKIVLYTFDTGGSFGGNGMYRPADMDNNIEFLESIASQDCLDSLGQSIPCHCGSNPSGLLKELKRRSICQ